MRKIPNLWLVIPCYNESEILEYTSKQLQSLMQNLINNAKISHDSKILFIDDGSIDTTWDIIKSLHQENSLFIGLKLAHNKGHQNALYAGLMTALNKCDCTISLDADLQDDISVVEEMLNKYQEGCEIVYGIRNSRKTDTFFKRFTAERFYTIMNKLDVEMVFNCADYRLMSNKALDCLKEYKENVLFLRGIVPNIGFKHDNVYYARKERLAGESKYSLQAMLKLAFNGILSFSIKPLRALLLMGVIGVVISLLGIIATLISWMTTSALSSTGLIVASIFFVGSINLLAIGVIGEYIGGILQEVKNRPKYLIDEFLS